MFLPGDFLVINLLPRPPDITTLNFHFTSIAGVTKWCWIWSFKYKFSNAKWCLRKHGEKSLCLHVRTLRILSTFVVTLLYSNIFYNLPSNLYYINKVIMQWILHEFWITLCNRLKPLIQISTNRTTQCVLSSLKRGLLILSYLGLASRSKHNTPA